MDRPPKDSPKVFLDACVLYPPLVRGILLGAAEAGLITPIWSRRVLDEWRLAAAREGGAVAEQGVIGIIERMQAAFPAAMTVPDATVEAQIDLPDPADVHVLAGALASGAGVLVTFNLRDFPTRKLSTLGVTPRHPDGFLWELLSHAPEAMDQAVRRAARAAGATDPGEVRRLLKRARLSRLGKAWEALAGS